jgi:hypothetical protein
LASGKDDRLTGLRKDRRPGRLLNHACGTVFLSAARSADGGENTSPGWQAPPREVIRLERCRSPAGQQYGDALGSAVRGTRGTRR